MTKVIKDGFMFDDKDFSGRDTLYQKVPAYYYDSEGT